MGGVLNGRSKTMLTEVEDVRKSSLVKNSRSNIERGDDITLNNGIGPTGDVVDSGSLRDILDGVLTRMLALLSWSRL